MKHFLCTFLVEILYISSTGTYQSTNLVRFYVSSWESKISHFDGLLLSKTYKDSVKKVQKSHLSRRWRVMQSLRKTNLLFQIWHEEFSECLPNYSKFWQFHFGELFFPKVYKVWAKKIQRSYLSWHWTVMQNLNKSDYLVIWKMVWGIGWAFIRALKHLKNCTFVGSFRPNHIIFQL